MIRLFDPGRPARCRTEGPRRVLLVEPDEVLRGALQCILAWENYVVVPAANRMQFRLQLRASQPEVVVLDGAITELRDGDLASISVPVVVFFGNSADGHVLSARGLEELLACIRRQLMPVP